MRITFSLLFSALLMMIFAPLQAQNNLSPDKDRLMVRFSDGFSQAEIDQFLDQPAFQSQLTEHGPLTGYGYELLVLEKSSAQSLSEMRQMLGAEEVIESVLPVYGKAQGGFAAQTDRLVVTFLPEYQGYSAEKFAKDLADQFNVNHQRNPWIPNTFLFQWNDQKVPMQQAISNLENQPYIQTIHPDFIFTPYVTTNDTFYNYQWSLNNTGSGIQYNGTAGADIEVENAWTITKGDSSIIIAVLDSGVDTLHPDLQGQLLPGYDATPQDQRGYPNTDYPQNAHGTACSGIVGAIHDNQIGVAGIAPNCPIMPVRVFYYVDVPGQGIQPLSTSTVFAEGIDYAWQNGADVLSNSWGIPDWLMPIFPNPHILRDAVKRAYVEGRDSLGIPMLFSSGNEGDPVIWPGNMFEAISVNATSMCDEWKNATSCDGENWWAGNWGDSLDISAPGVKIYTCDMTDTLGYGPTDYEATFNGTSAACPHAAAVMGLILSERPDLNILEARYVIESSCEKVGGFAYATVKQSGTWDPKLGFGRINAYQALLTAQAFDSIPPVGMAEPYANNLRIWPNPSTGILQIQWPEQEASSVQIQLLDLSGKTIFRRNQLNLQETVNLNFSDLPKGIYLLSIQTKRQQFSRKLILN